LLPESPHEVDGLVGCPSGVPQSPCPQLGKDLDAQRDGEQPERAALPRTLDRLLGRCTSAFVLAGGEECLGDPAERLRILICRNLSSAAPELDRLGEASLRSERVGEDETEGKLGVPAPGPRKLPGARRRSVGSSVFAHLDPRHDCVGEHQRRALGVGCLDPFGALLEAPSRRPEFPSCSLDAALEVLRLRVTHEVAIEQPCRLACDPGRRLELPARVRGARSREEPPSPRLGARGQLRCLLERPRSRPPARRLCTESHSFELGRSRIVRTECCERAVPCTLVAVRPIWDRSSEGSVCCTPCGR
jgi:hypothetical protein